MSTELKESLSLPRESSHAKTVKNSEIPDNTAIGDPFCSQLSEFSLRGIEFHLPLLLATVVVGGLAATLTFSSEVYITTHTVLGEVVSHLLYGGLMMSVTSFAIIAACSYSMQSAGRDVQHHLPLIWLPLATLMVTTITVVLASQLWYINHHSQPETASIAMALTFLVIALLPMLMEMGKLRDQQPKAQGDRPKKGSQTGDGHA